VPEDPVREREREERAGGEPDVFDIGGVLAFS
jgi:hypothetical protein